MKTKLDKKDIPCRWEKHWFERHPYGSTTADEEMWECECPAEGDLLKQIDIRINSLKVCGLDCPGYQSAPVEVCGTHGEFVGGYCGDCENDFYREMDREREEEESK